MAEEISNDKKADILISALEERYKSIHEIRTRVQSICVWSLGLLLGASGWLIQSTAVFNVTSTLLFIAIILSAYFVLRFYYFEDLEKGFKSQLKVAATIEESLNLYKVGYYIPESVYPLEWRHAGSKSGSGKYFTNSYLLMWFGGAILAIMLILKTCYQ